MERTNSRRRKAGILKADNTHGVVSSAPKDQFAAPLQAPSWGFRTAGFISGLVLLLIVSAVLLNRLAKDSLLLRGLQKTLWGPGLQDQTQTAGDIAIRLHPDNHIGRPPTTLTFSWEITKGFRYPDGVRKEVYLINGQLPGETIEARSGDRIIVNVTNLLSDEGLAIHWHGLMMKGANNMDGAVGLTQDPIPEGESYLYNFTIAEEEFGTFWYHGHEKTQRDDGLYGGLVVHRPLDQLNEKEIYRYDEEILLLVGDWYHRPSTEVLRWYMNSRSFGNEPVPDSLVVNGKGDFSCDMAVPARPVDCIPFSERSHHPFLQLGNGRIYRLRLINTGSLTGFSMRMHNASFSPFQVDGGHEIRMAEAQGVGIVYPGERVDVILQTGAPDRQSYLEIEMDDENFKYPNPALDPLQKFPVKVGSESTGQKQFLKPELEYYNLQAAVPNYSLPIPWSDEPWKFVVYTTTLKLARHHNIPMGFINHTSWSPQSPPLLSLARAQYDQNQLSPHIPLAKDDAAIADGSAGWVEIVINNLDDGGHPFHLHGYSFYVVSVFPPPIPWSSEKPPFTAGGTGMYNYNPFDTPTPDSPAGPYNLANPIIKDTVFVPQRGYVVIRFRADNKGTWMMHCHVGWHLGSGMAMSWEIS
ncbi:uncharacterized protein Z520_07542 [Fonsecaea multimorphosa CBS 102226]|uniref:Multicopper oxidase n=1 Tax=Fonsecaea multimorphosa CBS 102226 TaxID=1442371 RepID=A0A0D2JTJ8_9EURO|nr:uncharacterized protein Z520_07542 [Fonsecaea multimorphosa CBS 102226]KIX96822.1 hypothetical protein Z520_07542 [Fonsecaea multimorphosa CBS 102226]OAL22502.1 hypothetical protein AYO22_07060 [Fonsecaea multimorphosa]